MRIAFTPHQARDKVLLRRVSSIGVDASGGLVLSLLTFNHRLSMGRDPDVLKVYQF